MDSARVSEIWEKQNQEYLAKCAGKTLVVTYSGGKDSTVCVHLLHRMQKKYGYETQAHLYAFPRHLYNPAYRSAVTAYWAAHGVPFGYHEPEESDPEIRQLADPCLVCQKVRKTALARQLPTLSIPLAKMVLVSGPRLWDLAGYALEHLTNHELAIQKEENAEVSRERFLEISQRFYPYLQMKEGYAVYRPMHFLNQEDIRLLMAESGAPPEDKACEFAVNRPKKFLGKYFEKFGLEFSYDGVMDFARRHLALEGKASTENIDKEEFLGRRY
jgi:tRNA(Ile)-lysidine synthase TilS/MesJ